MRALPALDRVVVHAAPVIGGIVAEDEWMAHVAATGEGVAHVWSTPAALVVPRSYERLPAWAAATVASAARGWSVQVRRSGGGIVPQGPGLVNLSLIWRSPSATPRDTDAVYAGLCATIAHALTQLGITVNTQAVEGSFCDGRFNLAANGRKLVGTAQAWRRIGGQPVTLAHAVVIFDADPAQLTAAANAFEAEAGSARRYRADAVTSVAQAWRVLRGAPEVPAELEARFVTALTERLAG